MSRPLRIEFEGALYHVTSRGNEKKAIYQELTDFELFLQILSAVCTQYNWIIHAYCLMTNHYHLLVETADGNLSKGMRQLNGVFTQTMNRKHNRVGHLFQGRFKAIIVDKDAYLLELSRYIVLNPIRAKMVNSIKEWPWSSWHCTTGSRPAPAWLATDTLLQLFDSNKQQAITEYIQFVGQGKGVTVWDNLQQQIFLGNDDFVAKYQQVANKQFGDLKEIPNKQRRSPPLTLQQYQAQATSRNKAIVNAYQSGGYTLKNIGEYFNLHYSQVSRIISKNKL